jgi:hypothetical protein
MDMHSDRRVDSGSQPSLEQPSLTQRLRACDDHHADRLGWQFVIRGRARGEGPHGVELWAAPFEAALREVVIVNVPTTSIPDGHCFKNRVPWKSRHEVRRGRALDRLILGLLL